MAVPSGRDTARGLRAASKLITGIDPDPARAVSADAPPLGKTGQVTESRPAPRNEARPLGKATSADADVVDHAQPRHGRGRCRICRGRHYGQGRAARQGDADRDDDQAVAGGSAGGAAGRGGPSAVARDPRVLDQGAGGRPVPGPARGARSADPAVRRRGAVRGRAADRPGAARRLARGAVPRHPDRPVRPADGCAGPARADARHGRCRALPGEHRAIIGPGGQIIMPGAFGRRTTSRRTAAPASTCNERAWTSRDATSSAISSPRRPPGRPPWSTLVSTPGSGAEWTLRGAGRGHRRPRGPPCTGTVFGAGRPCLLLVGNRVEYVLAVLACLHLGAAALPCSEQLRPKDLALRLRRARPALIVCDERNLDELAAASPDCPVLIVGDGIADAARTAASARRPRCAGPGVRPVHLGHERRAEDGHARPAIRLGTAAAGREWMAAQARRAGVVDGRTRLVEVSAQHVHRAVVMRRRARCCRTAASMPTSGSTPRAANR